MRFLLKIGPPLLILVVIGCSPVLGKPYTRKVDKFNGNVVETSSETTSMWQNGVLLNLRVICVKQSVALKVRRCSLFVRRQASEWSWLRLHPKKVEFLIDGERVDLDVVNQDSDRVIKTMQGANVVESVQANINEDELTQIAKAKQIDVRVGIDEVSIPKLSEAVDRFLQESSKNRK